MPNGGSDCCGTCWFNAKTQGESGYAHARDPEPAFCTIRNLLLDDPFWTYCTNHPYKNPDKLAVPIGPVFRAENDHGRVVWVPSPDTETIRQTLLELPRWAETLPESTYPGGLSLAQAVVWQLGEFHETRAVEGLQRIVPASAIRQALA